MRQPWVSVQEGYKRNNADHKKKPVTQCKCEKCVFFGKTEMELKKHSNIKHPNKCVDTVDEKKSMVKVI